MSEKCKQPPIGVEPHWCKYQQRIKELSEAISRYVSYLDEQSTGNTRDIEVYELLHRWAFDLSEICKLEAILLKKDRKL